MSWERKESVNCTFSVNVHDICVNCVIWAYCSDLLYVFNSFICVRHQSVCVFHDSYDVPSVYKNSVMWRRKRRNVIITCGMKVVSWQSMNDCKCVDEA